MNFYLLVNINSSCATCHVFYVSSRHRTQQFSFILIHLLGWFVLSKNSFFFFFFFFFKKGDVQYSLLYQSNRGNYILATLKNTYKNLFWLRKCTSFDLVYSRRNTPFSWAAPFWWLSIIQCDIDNHLSHKQESNLLLNQQNQPHTPADSSSRFTSSTKQTD